MNNHNSGFTLWQLTGILGILAIVAAILFPIFNPQVHGRRKTSCLSNEKQIGLAFQEYTQDYDGKIPAFRSTPSNIANAVDGTGWIGHLEPYSKSVCVFKCPSDKNPGIEVTGVNLISISYALNSNTAQNPWVSTYQSPGHSILVFEVTNSSANIIDVTEGRTTSALQVSPAGNGVNGRLSSSPGALPTATDQVRYATGQLDNSSNATSLDQYKNQSPRHDDGSCFLLADGHVKWMKPENVSAGGIALKSTNPQSSMGCAADGSQHPGAFPCAEGTANGTHRVTFSVE